MGRSVISALPIPGFRADYPPTESEVLNLPGLLLSPSTSLHQSGYPENANKRPGSLSSMQFTG